MSKVWFITGLCHGCGRQFVEAALSCGDRVAATPRSTDCLAGLLAVHGEQVLPLAVDVTDKSAAGGGSLAGGARAAVEGDPARLAGGGRPARLGSAFGHLWRSLVPCLVARQHRDVMEIAPGAW